MFKMLKYTLFLLFGLVAVMLNLCMHESQFHGFPSLVDPGNGGWPPNVLRRAGYLCFKQGWYDSLASSSHELVGGLCPENLRTVMPKVRKKVVIMLVSP